MSGGVDKRKDKIVYKNKFSTILSTVVATFNNSHGKNTISPPKILTVNN